MYDIEMDKQGVKIRKKLFGLCSRYLHHIQFSVFEGQLDRSEVRALENSIRQLVRASDSVILFENIYDKPPIKKMFGNTEDQTSNFI
jgi:CRISPR-associated protein Cas2